MVDPVLVATMAGTETEERGLWRVEARAVEVGFVGGLLAGVGMGLVLQFGTDLLPVLGAFLGRTSTLLGWIVHLFVSVVYGVVFAVVVTYPSVRSFVDAFGVSEYVLVGVTYATMIAAVSIAILPFVFELPWPTAASRAPLEGVPGPTRAGLVPAAAFAAGHLVYGAVLGAVYGVVDEPSE